MPWADSLFNKKYGFPITERLFTLQSIDGRCYGDVTEFISGGLKIYNQIWVQKQGELDIIEQASDVILSLFAIFFGGDSIWWCLLDDVRTFFEQNPEDFAD